MSDPYEMSAQELIRVLQCNGFRPCDIAACNCGSWHQVKGWPERHREIDEATADFYQNGETLLGRITRIVERIAELKVENEQLQIALKAKEGGLTRQHQKRREAEALLDEIAEAAAHPATMRLSHPRYPATACVASKITEKVKKK